ncbi:MAG: hypothetical protein RMM10_11725, partial [Anaerolineae bacterium]|uniref:hypothetical protein n=1 Tax=Thermoflexus sp. TaxID=1969742 RepID=UPI00260040BD
KGGGAIAFRTRFGSSNPQLITGQSTTKRFGHLYLTTDRAFDLQRDFWTGEFAFRNLAHSQPIKSIAKLAPNL